MQDVTSVLNMKQSKAQGDKNVFLCYVIFHTTDKLNQNHIVELSDQIVPKLLQSMKSVHVLVFVRRHALLCENL